jgi:hypothetical protein
MRYFTKHEIIETMLDLPMKLDKKVISERAWLDRLNESIEILKTQKILFRNKPDSIFFKRYVNLEPHIVKEPRNTHYFGPVTALLLMVFLSQYEHPFIKSYKKMELVSGEIADDWFSKTEETVKYLMDRIFDNEDYFDKDFMTINILSQFANLAGRELQHNLVSKQVDSHINLVAGKLMALSDGDKAIVYKEKVEKLLIKIESEIEQVVSQYGVTEKKLYEFDLDLILNKEKVLDETIKDITLHMDE